ncbi:hypothetical protein ACIBQ6_01335 [Nonomuraea sp. NPDC049655]|uniref:hypothetical protein n=1 Tax=Nonomuraea sp. NPDC049655 TaxID=3364355 RepID=UPI0037B897C9
MSMLKGVPPVVPVSRGPRLAGTAIGGVALLVATFAAMLVPAATGARAAIGTTKCTGSQTVTYTPGLTDQPREVTVSGTAPLLDCVSTSDPTIFQATSTFSATGTFSCTSGTRAGSRKITWNNGNTSTLSSTSTVSLNGAETVVLIKGVVVDGEFKGARWTGTFAMFGTKPLACLTTQGLAGVSGPLTLSIGSL